jgi:hypothetical protein
METKIPTDDEIHTTFASVRDRIERSRMTTLSFWAAIRFPYRLV